MSKLVLHRHLEKLVHFEAAARLGKISAAAKTLHTSPAAISRSIRILEEQLSERLVIRKQSGITLSPAGQKLLTYSESLLRETEHIERSLRRDLPSQAAILKVGTHESLAGGYWPKVLKAFFKKLPNIQINLTSSRIDDLVTGLRERRFDLIVSVQPTPSETVRTKTIYETEMALFAGTMQKYPKTHPLRTTSALKMTQINQCPVLTDINANPRQGTTMKQHMVENGFDLGLLFELNSFEAAAQLAREGIGIALLPDRSASQRLKRKELRRLKVLGNKSGFGRHSVCASWLRDQPEDHPTKTLLSFLS